MKIEFTGSEKEKKKIIKYLAKKKMKFSELKENEIQNELTESKKIKFNIKKTEAEWIRWMDKTVIKYVPKWYEFLNWVVLLGLLNYISEKSGNLNLKLLYGVSIIGMSYYLQSYFYSFEFYGVPFIKKESIKRIFSLVISGLLATGTYLFIQSVIPLFEK